MRTLVLLPLLAAPLCAQSTRTQIPAADWPMFNRDLAVTQKADGKFADRLRRAVTTRFLDTNEFSLSGVPREERLIIGEQTTGRLGARHDPAEMFVSNHPIQPAIVIDTARIASAPLFADLPAAELEALAGAMGEAEVDAGTEVVTVDESGSTVYLIEAGEAEVIGAGGPLSVALGATRPIRASASLKAKPSSMFVRMVLVSSG